MAGWLQLVCDCDTQIFLFFATWQDVTIQFILKQLITATDVQNFTLGCIEIHLPSLGPVCQWREVMLKTRAISFTGNRLKNLRVVCRLQNISLLRMSVFNKELLTTYLRPSSISLMKTRYNSGPNTEPWGTSGRTHCHPEHLPVILTLCFLSLNHDLIQFKTLPFIPWFSNFINKRWWGTWSNALAKSR